MKKGFTTGTCAQAATKAACLMLIKRKVVNSVTITLPNGQNLTLGITGQRIDKDSAQCAVIKDSGDDPDITDKAKIYARVNFLKNEGIIIKGGEGVGKVTLPGLAVKLGEWAINPVPRKMILQEASKLLPKGRGFEIIISVPEGKKLAKNTYNPRLGIIGGISIIGTTGIVEPRSLAAYQATLKLELNVLKAQGHNQAVLVLGYLGEKFCQDNLKIKENTAIKIGDHIGFMLKECVKKKIKEVLLIGHIGKLIKLTQGQFNTHYSFGDGRLEGIAKYAQESGAGKPVIKKILSQNTAEAAAQILKAERLEKVFVRIAQEAKNKAEGFVGHKLTLNCILLSLKGEVLGKTNAL